MNKTKWTACTDPAPMLGYLRRVGKLSRRKSRLFVVACCNRIGRLLTDQRSRHAVDVAERYADGEVTYEELDAAFEAAFDVGAALAQEMERDEKAFVAAGRDPVRYAAWAASSAAHPDECTEGTAFEAAHAAELPMETLAQCDLLRCLFGDPFHSPKIESSWLTSSVTALAEAIYDNKAFENLPILAMLLQEAGCKDPAILGHCRSEGVHARGCWVIDSVLGKQE